MMNINLLDILLGLIAGAICVMSFKQRVMRQFVTLGILFLLTAVVGFAYRPAAYYLQAIGGDATSLREAVIFIILLAALWVALEVLLRRWFPDMSIPALGVVDAILAIIPGVVCAIIAVSLVFSALAFSTSVSWRAVTNTGRTTVTTLVETSALRPLIVQFLRVYMLSHRLWFSPPPPVFQYTINTYGE